MKKLLVLALILTGTAFAVLPPCAQSLREIEAIVSDPELYQLLGGAESVQGIFKTNGGYAVFTQNCFLKVDIKYLPTQRIGPAAFELRFSQPVDMRICQPSCQ